MAVLRLDRPVRYAPHIAPICLPEVGRDPAPGTQAYVAGWGALIPEDVTGPLISILVPEVKRPSVLQVVNVPVITNEKCERWHNDQGIQVFYLHSSLQCTLVEGVPQKSDTVLHNFWS